MSIFSLCFRIAVFTAAIAATGCSGHGLLPEQNPASSPPVAGLQQRAVGACPALAGIAMLATACDSSATRPALVPMATYTYELKNGTKENVSWRRLDENCMKENVPNVTDVHPDETVQYVVDTNGGCCRCSHETSWFVLRYSTPNGDYRDVGFDKAVGQSWVMSNRGTNSDLYYCSRLGGASIKGLLIRGNKCP